MKDSKLSPTSGAAFELRPLNYYRHPIFDHTGDLNHNLTVPSPPCGRGSPSRLRRLPLDSDAETAPQVYIRCPGRLMPFRVLVVVAGLIQIDLAVFAMYFLLTNHPAHAYFPQWGPLMLDGEGRHAAPAWFALELLAGLWLVANVVLRVSRPAFTLWLWTVLTLTMASLVHFCWSIPTTYGRYGGFEVLGKFSIQLLFHLLLIGMGREQYRQQYADSSLQATV